MTFNVMLLAAGKGTRLTPLTLKYPKPCVPFLNVPMGLYQFPFLEKLFESTGNLGSAADTARVVVNTFYRPEQVREMYSHQELIPQKILFSDESHEIQPGQPAQILGGAGGLKFASHLMHPNAPILLLNADEVYFPQDRYFLKKALDRHLSNGNLATVVVTEHPEAGKKFGALWTDRIMNGNSLEDLQVKEISKTMQATDQLKPWHFIGPLWLSWNALNLIQPNREQDIFYNVLRPYLLNEKVEVFPIEAEWFETGNGSDYLASTKEVMQRVQEGSRQPFIELMQNLIRRYDPSTVIKGSDGDLSLISESILELGLGVKSEYGLRGINIIGASAAETFRNLSINKALIKNSILFDEEIINLDYFK